MPQDEFRYPAAADDHCLPDLMPAKN